MFKPHITVGISGGIAAYKVPQFIRDLVELGYSVSCIVTQSALDFVTKTTLETLCTRPVIGPSNGYNNGIIHLESKNTASVFVVIPATANFIAKAAHGIADDVLTTAFLAYDGPKLIVPAMHNTMWENPATQANIDLLKKRGITILGPDTGKLSSGDFGQGRMISIDLVILKLQLELYKTATLDNYSVLVAIGGTQEPIDTVRVITNLSSGKLGIAISHGFALSGPKVTVISTVEIPQNPHIASVIYCKTAMQLKNSIEREWPHHDLLVMPAAVSDFTPLSPADSKLRRLGGEITLNMRPTADILEELPRYRNTQRVIGFCLSDSNDLVTIAKDKLIQKKLDAIIANAPNQFGASHRDFEIIRTDRVSSYRDRTLSETASILINLAAELLPPIP